MSKRFTQTEIWDEDWFLDMPKQYKLFWFYVKDQCNHAGIWRPNKRLFEAMVEAKVDLNEALSFFNSGKERITVLKSGHWFLIDFFVFQYGETFNPANRVHKSIQNIYNQEGIILASIRGLIDHTDRVKDKDKDKDNITSFEKSEKLFLDTKPEKPKTWRSDFEIYKSECMSAFNEVISDPGFIAEQQKFYPNVDIALSLENAVVNFWSTEAGWKNKKGKRSNIDWKATFRNAIKLNKVYKQNGNSNTLPQITAAIDARKQQEEYGTFKPGDKEGSRVVSIADAI